MQYTSLIFYVASTTLYTCCRGRREKQNQLTPQTRKHRGSCKVEGYCVSRMMVTRENNGKVSYIQTRTPGISEAKHLPLPLTVKQEVREKV